MLFEPLKNMKTPQEIELLSWKRLEEARILYANNQFDGAFYLAGYAVELMLKYRICKLLSIPNLFDETDKSTNIIDGIGEIRRAIKTHNLNVLLAFSGLTDQYNVEMQTDPAFVDVCTMLIEVWTEQSRYDIVGTKKQSDVLLVLEALGDQTKGVLLWIQTV